MQKSFKALIAKCVPRFTAWPEDALDVVANTFLSQIEMDSKIRNECVKMCKHFHSSVSNISRRYVIFLSALVSCC
jgi:dynein heavy chain